MLGGVGELWRGAGRTRMESPPVVQIHLTKQGLLPDLWPEVMSGTEYQHSPFDALVRRSSEALHVRHRRASLGEKR